MKKLFSLMVALVMVLTAFSGISALAEEPDVLVFVQVDDGFSQQMSNAEYQMVHDKIVEDINIDIQPIYFPSDVYWSRVGMMLTTPDDQLDIICRVDTSRAKEWYDDEVIQDLTDMIENNVPNYLAACDEYDIQAKAREEIKLYGKDVGFPMISTMSRATSFQIRTDWLEKLGMDMPETIEDLEAYFEAVKTQDPDGNGVDDTYGICGTIWGGSVFDVLCYYYLPAGNSWWLDEDGVLQHPGLHPNYKAALAKLVEWQENGYLPPEALLSSDDQRLDWFVNNQLGAVAGWYSAPIGGRVTLVEKVPEAWYEPFNITGLPDAANAVRNEKAFSHMNVVTSTADLDVVARYYNYMFTTEGWMTLTYGIEGVTYDIIDGAPVPRKDEGGTNLYYSNFVPQMQTKMSPYGFFPGSAYNETLYRTLTDSLDKLPGFDTPDKLVSYSYVGTDSEGIKADLDTYIDEQRAKVLAGETPVDDWDGIMQTWLEMGGTTLTNDRNAQYQEQTQN